MVFKSRDWILNTITMAWLTKITSHMATAELLRQEIGGSMMANSKMEQPMAIFERFVKMVAVIMMNIKMVRNYDIFEIRRVG